MAVSKPREKHETGEQDLFRSRLDQIINMKHELVRLTQAIDWPVLEERFGAGVPALPTRLIPTLIDQNPLAHCRRPIDMIFQGRSCSVRHA
jgi:hypothetical protein